MRTRSGTDGRRGPGAALSALVLRLAFRVCVVATRLSCAAAARLADDFRVLGSAAAPFRPVTLVLQLPVLACWLIVRPISLVGLASCCGLATRLDGR
jgi:hypothetical protein